MLESQKLSFHQFMTEYKHGVYILTSDSCEICHKYKQSIEYINNGNLYFVDVITQEDRDLAYKITERGSFPMTTVFRDNQLELTRLGQLFDTQLEEIFEYLKEFGDKPLSQEEKDKRIKAFNSRCELSYYIFPPSIGDSDRNLLINKAIDFNELPLDIDQLADQLDIDQRFHLVEGMMPFAKLVIYKDNNTNTFSNLAQRLLMAYTSRVKNAKFIIRNIEETLNATDCPSIQ